MTMDINTKSIGRKEREIAELSSRGIPIAVQQTLTATVRHAWRYGRSNTDKEFKTRNNWSKRSQTYQRAEGLDVDKMVAKTGSSAEYMAEQEKGFTRNAGGNGGAWVPTAEASDQSGERTKPITRKYRKGRIRLRRKVKKRASSPAQQRLFNMTNAVSTNGYFWGTLGNTKGMWHLAGSTYKGRMILTGVRLLYSANKRTVTTTAHEWHEPAVMMAVNKDEPKEYDKALARQLKRLNAKYKMKR